MVVKPEKNFVISFRLLSLAQNTTAVFCEFGFIN